VKDKKKKNKEPRPKTTYYPEDSISVDRIEWELQINDHVPQAAKNAKDKQFLVT
jgi:hypothetical protein